MELFGEVIALLLGAAVLAALARRIGAPYPARVALAAVEDRAGGAAVPTTRCEPPQESGGIPRSPIELE